MMQMLQRKMLTVCGALAAVALAAGASPAKADVIFGNLAPSPACGAVPVGGVGSVCAPNVTFTSGGDTVVAHGFPGAPDPAAGTDNLTPKPVPPNVLAESGLGVQAHKTSTPCPNPRCLVFPLPSLPVRLF